MVNLKQPLQSKNTHQLVAEQNNIKELLDMESAAARKLKAEERAYKAVRARLESALKVLVSHYYSLFQPLHSRAEKHGYAIPEIFVDDYEFDDEEDSMPYVNNLFPEETTPDGFTFLVGEKIFCRREDAIEFSIHIPTRYLEPDGLEIMQQDAVRIASNLDQLDAERNKRLALEQEEKDRAMFEELKKRFGERA